MDKAALRTAQKPTNCIVNDAKYACYAIYFLLCRAKRAFVQAQSAASSTYDPDDPALGLGPLIFRTPRINYGQACVSGPQKFPKILFNLAGQSKSIEKEPRR